MSTQFPNLFSPLEIRGVEIRNRIFSTGHMTTLAERGRPGKDLAAYHAARAEGGAGLVIVEVATVHESASYTSDTINANDDECIPGYELIARSVHEYGCRVFGQLFHPGREMFEPLDGSQPVAYAPSAVPNERFHVMPRPMSVGLIGDVVDGYARAAARLERAGLDGVEIVASHGYLPAQFLNHRLNLRGDEYGGDFNARIRFLREILAAIRAGTGPSFVIGMRISGDEKSVDGLQLDEVTEACVALDADGDIDYFNVIAGTTSTLAGSIHVVPPMWIDNAYVAPYAATVKARVSKPVFVAGRINQPQMAEEVIRTAQADMCGMTRAQICDPQLANKSRDGRVEDIRACIGCNQACIGHMQSGFPISCIQHPETGRERRYYHKRPATRVKKVLVAGGGMKAAAVAAARGHQVTLCERAERLGGQTLLAQLLPGRAEFGGIVTNLSREMELARVDVLLRQAVTRAYVEAHAPDSVIIATGAEPYLPTIEGAEEAHIVDAWSVIRGEANVGHSVVVADWRCDWVGLGVAEKLARDGCHVRLCVNGYMPGQLIQQYVRDHWVGILQTLGVEMKPYMRVFGADAQSVYFQHTANDQPVELEAVDTLVVALGHRAEDSLETSLDGWPGELQVIGDCLAPRTAEEAVFEGLKAAVAL